MIDEQTLSKCLDNLAEINANLTNSALKRLTLEIGYVLKQELDNVAQWNQQFKGKKNKPIEIDINKLMEDNNQLFNENKKLQEVNMKLKETIDQRIPRVENAISNINQKFQTFTEVLSKA